MLPLLNSCRIDLLDNARLIAQLCALERRTARGGKDSIDHPPNGHDDLCNVVAGLAAINGAHGAYDHAYRGWSDGGDAGDRDGARAWRAARLALYIGSGGKILM